jgi:nucleoside-diphosphate-sugar epimerase
MKSAFLSDLFHALAAGSRFEMPVSRQATSWLMSIPQIVTNFIHALGLPEAALSEPFAVTLPAVRTCMRDLVSEVARQTEVGADLVDYIPDPVLEAGFGAFPPLDATIAERLGFESDGTVEVLVQRTLAGITSASASERDKQELCNG